MKFQHEEEKHIKKFIFNIQKWKRKIRVLLDFLNYPECKKL